MCEERQLWKQVREKLLTDKETEQVTSEYFLWKVVSVVNVPAIVRY